MAEGCGAERITVIQQVRVRKVHKSCFWLVMLTLTGAVWAQVPVQVPPVPAIRLPNAPDIDALDVRQPLRDLRRLKTRELLRRYPRELEADNRGAPIVRAEIALYGSTAASIAIAERLGFRVMRESTLDGLDIKVAILQPPARTSTRSALRRLRRADPSGTYDFNHVYIESGATLPGDAGFDPGFDSVVVRDRAAESRIGLIDTGVDLKHPSLRDASIKTWGCESRVLPAAHGTAVASLLVGKAESFVGSAWGAQLFAADVYCNEPTGGAVERIIAALAWLAAQDVPVINVSLVGPPNALLAKVVTTLTARGHLIVAAVGNDGPAAPPLYPAAYPGVIGVTGVDVRRRVLLEAGRGPQVDFAAPGADIGAAGVNGYVAVRGTSFAAPIITGLLARNLRRVDAIAARTAVEALSTAAVDLGSRGRDKTFGYGLAGEIVRTSQQQLVQAEAR